MKAQPISPPTTPPSTMAANASARASGDGRAESGRCPGSATTAIVCSARCAPSSSCPPSTRRRTSPTCCTDVRTAVPDAGILVVDDNSPDGTADLAEATAPPIGGESQVLRRDGKAGLGSAYRAGFAVAIDQGAEVLVEMDSDLSHDPADLPALLSAVEHGADLAIGSRYVPGGRIPNWSWHRKMLSRWGNRYAAGALGLAVNDATAGFRAYRATALKTIDLGAVRAEGYGFQIEMTYRLVRAGRAGRGGADLVRGPRAGHVEDVGPHRGRGARPGDVVGGARPASLGWRRA